MALNATELAEDLTQRFEAARPELVALFQSDPAAGMRRQWLEIATAIVEHIKANAEVLPAGTPAMAAGGDPVTGKGKIT